MTFAMSAGSVSECNGHIQVGSLESFHLAVGSVITGTALRILLRNNFYDFSDFQFALYPLPFISVLWFASYNHPLEILFSMLQDPRFRNDLFLFEFDHK